MISHVSLRVDDQVTRLRLPSHSSLRISSACPIPLVRGTRSDLIEICNCISIFAFPHDSLKSSKHHALWIHETIRDRVAVINSLVYEKIWLCVLPVTSLTPWFACSGTPQVLCMLDLSLQVSIMSAWRLDMNEIADACSQTLSSSN